VSKGVRPPAGHQGYIVSAMAAIECRSNMTALPVMQNTAPIENWRLLSASVQKEYISTTQTRGGAGCRWRKPNRPQFGEGGWPQLSTENLPIIFLTAMLPRTKRESRPDRIFDVAARPLPVL